MTTVKMTVCPEGHGNVRLERVGHPGQVLMRSHLDGDSGKPCEWSERPFPPGYVSPSTVEVQEADLDG